MNQHRRFSRKRSADQLESNQIVKRTKHNDCSRHHKIAKPLCVNHRSYSQYRHCNILPDIYELSLQPEIAPHVETHIVKGSYSSWEHYLNTQFNLLREDFVAPLRKGIFNYKNDREPYDVKVYQRATFTEMVLSEDGILLSVEFKRVDNNMHQTSLINGTLLCFSHDNFETILFATVVNRNDRSQNNQKTRVKVEADNDILGILGIHISNCNIKIQEYTIIEAPAHYETYHHFLTSLKCAPCEMPFTSHLCDVTNIKIRRPLYLNRGNSVFKMGDVLEFEKDTHHSSSFDIISEWPSYGTTKLNKYQHEALKHALTHEIALIQGPPGTGKTFIGKKIVEVLLINKAKWDNRGTSPILVVCYTNQALDQFLEKLIKSDIIKKLDGNSRPHGNIINSHKIVRIGGGCTSGEVEECLIWRLHSKENKTIAKKPIGSIAYFKMKRELKRLSKHIKQQMQVLISNDPPSIEDLSEFIAPAHYDQLRKLHAYRCIDVWLKDNYFQQNQCIRSLARQPTLGNMPKSTHAGYNTAIYENHESKNDFAVVKLRNHHTKWKIAYNTAEAESINDINLLSLNERKKLYHHWIKLYQDNLYNEVRNLIDIFNKTHAKLLEAHGTKDAKTLQNAMVIGMTTTGAAKHRDLLEVVKPKIVIVEEAAEVIESHIIPCISTATEHLILIGDQKQLQPKPQDYRLACKYNLNVSLFERLILNRIPHKTLAVQYRMRPEIAELIYPHIYNTLENGTIVTEYEDIKGIKTNMYFFNHKYRESKGRNSHSYYNAREADLVAGLCNYLLNQDYKPGEITVLAAYASQVKQLKRLIPAAARDATDTQAYVHDSHVEEISKHEDEQYVKIKTIDNYQGEENDIIILSLVRSNEMDKLGFLKFENRMCVALSRARKGLYCFGNFDLLYKSDIWKKILDDLKNKNQTGGELLLCCSNHPQSITTITRPDDFQKVPGGGCLLQCNAPLPCGHTCSLKCHVKDVHHNQYICKETCLKKCKSCGSPCKLECFMGCSKRCEVLIEKTIPGCNHTQRIPCHMEPDEFKCKEKCNKTCLRGHPCTLTCSEVCKCLEMKTKTLECGHKVTLYCYENYAIPDCTAPCNKTCTTNKENPHKCTKRCSDICGNCEAMVEVTLPWCGHKQQVPCHKQCRLNLFADTINCTKMIVTTLPVCGHNVEVQCGANILDHSCLVPVTVMLPCGHSKEIECYKLQGMNKEDILASEKCYVKVTRIFQICKHTVELPCCHSQSTECPVKCNTVLLCGHKCSGTCHECHQGRLHKPCMFHVSKLLCGHETTMNCSSTMIEPYPSCSYRCERSCPHSKCSHKCRESCTPCNRPCNWKCPHYKCTRKCYERCNRPRCYQACPRLNKCNHPCIGVCGEKCPDVCKLCDKEQFLQLYVSLSQFKTKDDSTFIQLDCGHLFKRTELDPWVDARSKEFQLISCPKCNQTIHLNQRRYANAIIRTYSDIKELYDSMNKSVETNLKLEAFMRYHTMIINVIKICGLSYLETLFQGISYEELKQFDNTSDEELKRFAASCHYNSNSKFCQGIREFIANKKENWLSAITIITNLFNSILCLLKFSHGHLEITLSLEVLLKFTLSNHKSLSLQVIQDVTCEQKRLALQIMINQLKKEITDHPDLQTVKQVENVLTPIRLKPLLSQQAERLYSKLSKLANKYGAKLVDKKYILTPKLPLLYTGRWTLCNEGHYYCIPQPLPQISCDFLTSQECPHCTYYDDDIDHMD